MCHLDEENQPPLPDLIPPVRTPDDWVSEGEIKWIQRREKGRKEEVPQSKKIFLLSSKIQTCPERRADRSAHSVLKARENNGLCWWPIPLSSVNSPRQHGLYHSSCKQGDTCGPKQFCGQLHDLSGASFWISCLNMNMVFALWTRSDRAS